MAKGNRSGHHNRSGRWEQVKRENESLREVRERIEAGESLSDLPIEKVRAYADRLEVTIERAEAEMKGLRERAETLRADLEANRRRGEILAREMAERV